jgi:diaminohydroxyphosphoribosylaminopyrimidine deaminase/5-amino-6-(5-phosphoribosylamino)uracil reductase
MLRRAGIEVTVGVCGSTAEELIAPFARWIRTRMPYVTLKMAMTMDGRIADAKGHSRWITHPAARAAVHRLRKRADAIMVGSGTLSKDDPSLTSSLRAAPAAWRIVTSASGRIPADCRLLCDGHAARTIVAMGPGATPSRRRCTEAAGARAIVVPAKDGKLMIRSLIKALGKMGLLHVVCEGGGALAASLVREKLVDEYWFFIAGRFLGDGGAVPVLRGCTWPLRSAPHVRIVSVSMVGPDVLVRGVPER